MTSDAATTDAAPERKDPVASIAGQVPGLSTGDRALLRRIYLTKSLKADSIVAKLLLRAGETVPYDPEAFAPWRLLAHVAALLSGTGGQQPHAPGRSFGAALHASGYSENRLLRLTAARGTPLYGQIVRAARMLAQAGEAPVNLWAVFDLVGANGERAEAARIRTARDYYAADARSVEGKNQ